MIFEELEKLYLNEHNKVIISLLDSLSSIGSTETKTIGLQKKKGFFMGWGSHTWNCETPAKLYYQMEEKQSDKLLKPKTIMEECWKWMSAQFCSIDFGIKKLPSHTKLMNVGKNIRDDNGH